MTQGKTNETDPLLRHYLLSSRAEAHGDSDINSVQWCPRHGARNLLATAGDDGVAKVWAIEQTA